MALSSELLFCGWGLRQLRSMQSMSRGCVKGESDTLEWFLAHFVAHFKAFLHVKWELCVSFKQRPLYPSFYPPVCVYNGWCLLRLGYWWLDRHRTLSHLYFGKEETHTFMLSLKRHLMTFVLTYCVKLPYRSFNSGLSARGHVVEMPMSPSIHPSSFCPP